MKETILDDCRRILLCVIAAFILALNINSFVHTGGLVPGGAAGGTILIQRILQTFFHQDVPYTPINLLLNAFAVYIGFRFVGKKFTLYSLLVVFLQGVFVDAFPNFVITYDSLLVSVFGGLINGFGISICLSADATSGGTDFIATWLSSRNGVDSWNVSLGINAVILVASGILFGWDGALYSIIYQFVSTQVIHALYHRYQQETLFVVTDHPHEITELIYHNAHHGATVLRGEGHAGTERIVVYSVVSRSDRARIVKKIREIDAKAFINTFRTEQVQGHFYRKPES